MNAGSPRNPLSDTSPIRILFLLAGILPVACNAPGTGSGPAPTEAGDRLKTSLEFETRVRDSDGAEMIAVPAGAFPMGSTEADVAEARESYAGWAEDWFEGEVPQHDVYLDAYWIDKYEVTNSQFARFIEAGGYDQRDLWTQEGWDWKTRERRAQPKFWLSPPWNEPQRPVVGVAWFEALAYCRWAGVRLPTDAEWERAAGWDAASSEKRVYPWGNEWEPARANTNESTHQETLAVGVYCPAGESPVGACDMAGNVWEWCSSLHLPYPYDATDGREDLEAQGTRVLRGGSWLNAPVEARTAYRLPPFPGDFILFDPTNGFRCAASGQ